MTLLLDTQVLLWAICQPARIPENWLARLVDRSNPVFFSASSNWEIAIKSSLERPFLHDAERTLQLAWHHRDPFDRLLIAQAKQMPSRLLTADSQLPIYSELVEFIG